MLKEKPVMEAKKSELIKNIKEGQDTVRITQDKILKRLAESAGNVLDDEDLIIQLYESKKTAHEMEVSMKENESSSLLIEETR
jgi:hypothetical protein